MPDADRVALVARLRQRLLSDAQSGGGWGYSRGRSSRIEPTAWALLALGARVPENTLAVDLAPHLAWLRSRQTANGILLDQPDQPPNFTANGTAACALTMLAALGDTVSKLLAALVTVKGLSVDEPDPRQNNRLQAWPWIPDTFSWVEPTSWCMLALKRHRGQLGQPAADRIAEAERMLVNRACDVGGWNFGNASVMGQDLRPYVPTTAVGLLALQDRPSEPTLVRALNHLEEVSTSEASVFALSLALLALHVHRRSTTTVDARLAADIDRAERLGNLQNLAMMLYALTVDVHDAEALRV